MPCFYPIPALVENGQVTLHPKSSAPRRLPDGSLANDRYSFTNNVSLPCGKCLGCRVTKAQEWATRIMHETQFHAHNKFITLTYDRDHCPKDVTPEHLRLFIKRLRHAARTRDPQLIGSKLRYFAAGEYGSITERPHYHVVLFGLGFRDETRYSDKLFTSQVLTDVWGMGHVRYGNVTHQSAAYVAGYAGGKTYNHKIDCDSNGEVRHAPFMRCSNRPGIGARYAEKYSMDLRGGSVFANGAPRNPPRYYRTRLKVTSPACGEQLEQALWQKIQDADPRHFSAEGRTAKLVKLQQQYRERGKFNSLISQKG